MVVTDYTIMNESYSSLSIEVRMCIDVCFVTMCGPSRVPNSNTVIVTLCTLYSNSFDAVSTESICACKLGSMKLGFLLFIVVNRDYAARIVATTLQNLQTLNAY